MIDYLVILDRILCEINILEHVKMPYCRFSPVLISLKAIKKVRF